MHSVSPYVFRSFKESVSKVSTYFALDKVGQFDLYAIVKDYIDALNSTSLAPKLYSKVVGSEIIYRFSNFVFDDKTRRVRGLFQVGKYGRKGDIVNVNTSNVEYLKTVDNAEVVDYYIDMVIPLGMDEGICLMLNHNGDGVKTLFFSLIDAEFRRLTTKVLQMNPLPYTKAYKEWLKGQAKELKLVKFNSCTDVADALVGKGHLEQTLTINSSRNTYIGTFEDLMTKGTDENNLLEMLTPMCSEVKATVKVGNRTRTFRMGTNLADQVCQIEIDPAQVKTIDGNPDIPQLISWCDKLMRELADNLYSVKVPL